MMAQPGWTDRTVRGPSDEYLTPEEFRRLFGLPAEWIDERVKDGTIPPPLKPTSRTVMFTWEHAACLALWLKLTGPGLEKDPPKRGKDSPP